MIGLPPDNRYRRSLRLKGYDYAQSGAYYVTIVTQDRLCVFGDVVDGAFKPNGADDAAVGVWDALTERFPSIDLDYFVVMPNHLHGIIVIANDYQREGAPTTGAPTTGASTRGAPTEGLCDARDVGAPLVGAPAASRPDVSGATRVTLGAVVGAFKSLTTNAYVGGVADHGWPPFPGRLCQRNYYEHIIRNEAALEHIRQYIWNNPAQWAEDRENPSSPSARRDDV